MKTKTLFDDFRSQNLPLGRKVIKTADLSLFAGFWLEIAVKKTI